MLEFYRGGKAAGREIYDTSPSSAKVMCGYTSPATARLHGV